MSFPRKTAKYPWSMPLGFSKPGVVTGPPVLLMALVLALLSALGAAPHADARARQDPAPDPTSEPVSGADATGDQAPVQPSGDPEAPVPGVPDASPDASTTTVAVLGPTAASDGKSESEKANQRVQLVVISLLVLAVVVAGATFVFWRRTSPARVASSEADTVVNRVGKL